MAKLLLLFTLLPPFLLQSFTIIGRVRDQSGQVVSGVRVSLLDDNYGSIRTVFVDSGGGFAYVGNQVHRLVWLVIATAEVQLDA